ncbi:hypothetical protein [Caulobacter sp. 17J65-9]|uniref:type IV pilus assembly protein FimV n=1 Tax=Caulobacter sp. 17J65-9 TaxID=2709382 RepID=UPI00196A11C6|nr:hypothetical protein [Caulobacter sp. 17J65-9]
MTSSAQRLAVAAAGLALTAVAGRAEAQATAPADPARIERELDEINAMRRDLARQMQALDARVEALETELHGPVATADAGAGPPTTIVEAPPEHAQEFPALPVPVSPTQTAEVGGIYEPGRGVVLMRRPQGELVFSPFTYARYINQTALAPDYTDAFGRTTQLHLREDVQLQKVTLNFLGWIADPRLRYQLYVWTSNTSQGLGAQVVVGGNLGWRFNEHFSLAAGIDSLPTTRSTNQTFPYWLRNDNRTIADEYFRGSYTSGIWAWGEITDKLYYRVMAGDNLSQLGVDAGQLAAGLNTVSGALWWMPTTGEYGLRSGFGDWEGHDKAATLFGVNFTRSREDAEEQPGQNAFENVQLRISDGTRIFQPGAFATDGQIRRATYEMLAMNGGVKYRGFSLDGEYYWRWLDDFKTVGDIPFDRFFDHGFQLQASAMPVHQTVQLYASGSKIFGEFGDPSDLALGLNWWPLSRQELKLNGQAIWLDRSPVGNNALPYPVGGDGWTFTTDAVLKF